MVEKVCCAPRRAYTPTDSKVEKSAAQEVDGAGEEEARRQQEYIFQTIVIINKSSVQKFSNTFPFFITAKQHYTEPKPFRVAAALPV